MTRHRFKDIFPPTITSGMTSLCSLHFPSDFSSLISISLSSLLHIVSVCCLKDLTNLVTRCMTSASELFSTRRSRPGRSNPDLESDSSSLYRLHSHHHHHHRRQSINHHPHRQISDGCDLLRRAHPRLRRFCHHPERRPVRDVQGTSQFLDTNSVDLESESNSFGNVTGSERLPGAVLLARARLLERLRGVSLSSNSRSNRLSLGDDQTESGDPNFQPEGIHVTYECNKKPQGLTQDAINCLHRQTFSTAEVKTEMKDCSICLESFTKGDKLISLPCTHSFHASCLNPWIRACGDCPYCRRAIAKD